MSPSLPVQPGQQALGGGDEVHHGGQEVVGQLPGGAPVVMAAAATARDVVLQVLGRGVEFMGQRPEVLRL